MARLKSVKPRLKPVRPTLAPAPGVNRDARRLAENPVRALYGTARWKALRLRVFARDGYICQATGVICSGKHPAANAPVCDHRRPHRGDLDLFWDEGNLQTVSKAHHDSEKQRLERRGLA